MRRLLLVLGLLLLPVFGSAQTREALLTPDGTLFTVESVVVASEAGGFDSSNLVLRAQQGTTSTQEVIPATIEHGAHTNPAVAYDAGTKTLFVFWLRHVGLMSSQLLFSCRDANGEWSPARTFGERWNYRRNLRIAVTRKVTIPAEDGSSAETLGAAVSVHLVWWESDTENGTESAQYAMVTIEDGAVVGDPDYLNLKEFAVVEEPAEPIASNGETTPEEPVVEDVDPSLLRQPVLFASPKQDSVLVIFGDLESKRLHQVRVRPTKPVLANGRLRVPVGRAEGSSGAPTLRLATESSRVEGIYGSSERLALFTRDAGKMRYVIMKDGVWTPSGEIALDEQITSGTAVDALRRLLNEN